MCEVSCRHVRLDDRAVVVVVLWAVCCGSVLAGWCISVHGVPARALRHDIRRDDGDVLRSMSGEHVRRCNGIDNGSVHWQLHRRSWHVLSDWCDVVVAVAVSSRYSVSTFSRTRTTRTQPPARAHIRIISSSTSSMHWCICYGVQVATASRERRRRAIYVPPVQTAAAAPLPVLLCVWQDSTASRARRVRRVLQACSATLRVRESHIGNFGVKS